MVIDRQLEDLPGEIIHQASHWINQMMRRDNTPEMLAQCQAWLNADSRHAAAYRRMSVTWKICVRAGKYKPPPRQS